MCPQQMKKEFAALKVTSAAREGKMSTKKVRQRQVRSPVTATFTNDRMRKYKFIDTRSDSPDTASVEAIHDVGLQMSVVVWTADDRWSLNARTSQKCVDVQNSWSSGDDHFPVER
ncbi:hypothetical protein KIN20_021982 [Parelaphostrongylus tenuis]|uniref:Uncharacterized protein n=1 Tax=Parelaphostrongylus tenuis TaxID=148309 RepID=A0AAD5QWI7_PARTN|nr:hypothetical protein KIN20_021982 [Parelaphostrongylus tenuis]